MPRWLLWFLIVIILAGIGLRFTRLGSKIVRFDEVFTRLHTTGHDEQREANPALYSGSPVPAKTMLTFLHHDSDKTLLDTIKVVVLKETTKPPLYYALAWGWTRLLGDDIGIYRALSALFGLFSLPALFWLSRELQFTRTGALIAVALMAVSPILVRQSQDARPYSIWLLITIIASAALLRALASDSRVDWAWYALAVLFSLYIQVLSVIVLLAHALYVVLLQRTLRSPKVGHYALASILGGLLFIPWFMLIVWRFHVFLTTTSYLSRSLGAVFTTRQWGLNITRLLVAGPWQSDGWLIGLSLLVLSLLTVAGYTLYRRAPRSTWLFITLLFVVSIGAFVLPDLLFGGQRSTRARYFVPAYLAAILALSYWLAILSERKWGRVALVTLLTLALVSTATTVQAQTWWGRSQIDLAVAALVNQRPNALLVSDTVFGVVAILADHLDEDVMLLLPDEASSIQIPDVDGPIFIYQPSDTLYRQFAEMPGVTLELIYQNDRWDLVTYSLYELTR